MGAVLSSYFCDKSRSNTHCTTFLSQRSVKCDSLVGARFFAVKDEARLRIGLGGMFFWTIFVYTPPIILGLLGFIKHPDLLPQDSEQIFSIVMRDLLSAGGFSYFVASILLASSVAAIMSTTDSLLLSIASICVVDFIAPFAKTLRENTLLRIGKAISVCTVIVGVGFGIFIKIDLKSFYALQNGFLLQMLPTYLIGPHWIKLKKEAIIAAIVCGLTTTLSIYFTAGNLFGVDPGVYGFIVHLIVLFSSQYLVDKLWRPFSAEDFLTDFEISIASIPKKTEPIYRPWIWPIFLLLLVLSGNFFRTSGVIDPFIMGFPAWAFTSLMVCIVWTIFGIFMAVMVWKSATSQSVEAYEQLL